MTKRGMSYDAPGTYARLIAPRYAAIADALVAAAALRENDDVLELGAGTGLVTTRVAPHVRSVVATDLSSDMLERARLSLRRRRNVTFALVDYGAALPYLDATFSLVLSGLTYVQDSPQALAEVARVLRTNGRLAFSMWGPTYHEKRLLNAALESIGGGRFPAAAPGRALRRLEAVGFRSVRRTDLDIVNRFADVEEYLAYRRGFGIPSVWTRAYYDRFLRAVHREASRTVADDGSFELGWTLTIVTARR
jgi:ubiquinone/menaquinone biosynthesis C-methylase UbiE